MGFRRFLISFIALVTIPIVILFLCFMGMGFGIPQFVLDSISFLLIVAIGLFVATKLGDRVRKADPEEIQREDDVLLQAVGFSQSILFILLSLMQSEDRLREALLYMTVITTVSFYILRAWAKIKDSPRLRYYSMIAFAFISINAVTSILKLYFNIPEKFLVDMGTIYSAIGLSFVLIAKNVFKKRYGYKG